MLVVAVAVEEAVFEADGPKIMDARPLFETSCKDDFLTLGMLNIFVFVVVDDADTGTERGRKASGLLGWDEELLLA